MSTSISNSRQRRIVLVNFDEAQYGAGRAVERLRSGLAERGVMTEFLVQLRSHYPRRCGVHAGPRILSFARTALDLLVRRVLAFRHPRLGKSLFTAQIFADSAVQRLRRLRPDLVHLHWLGDGFGRIESLARLQAPIVWTLHDMWPFTGGCHYAGDCTRYRAHCGACPQLDSSVHDDLSAKVWQRKKRAWTRLGLIITAPSRWLATRAAESSLFQGLEHHVIPNGLDPSVFKPEDQQKARAKLGLSSDARVIAFGAVHATTDPRKGFDLLRLALEKMPKQVRHNLRLLVFGSTSSSIGSVAGFPAQELPKIHDDRLLATVLSAADVFVAPSRQDNLPNSVMEALACATPCAAFSVGGLPEMIDHRRCGYLARPFDVEELAAGIAWIVEDPQRRRLLGESARTKTLAEFDQRIEAARFDSLYQDILARPRRASATSL